MPTTVSRREARLSVRLTNEERECIQRAALLETNGDLSRFVASAATRVAKTVIHEHGVSHVTEEFRQRFYDLLLNPPRPSDDLLALATNPVPEGFELEK
jgi:uncharacterized protein (DUF1778 family)